MRKVGILSLFLCLLVVACSPTQPKTPPTSAPNTTPTVAAEASAYPAPATSAPSTSAYPAGQPQSSSTDAPAVIPTAAAGTGMVKAKIYNNGSPLPDMPFFLATTLKNSSGQELATSLDRATSPSSFSAPDGSIIFYNVKPGRYGLMMISGLNSYLLLNPLDGKALLMTVKADETLDLGDLKFDNLPLN